MKRFALGSLAVAAFALAAASASAQNVKITPLGSHAGELCMRDRATIFESKRQLNKIGKPLDRLRVACTS